jgi:hypothetical protein
VAAAVAVVLAAAASAAVVAEAGKGGCSGPTADFLRKDFATV